MDKVDNIVEQIYKSCDERNTNSVSVSTLINYIRPYMQNSLGELDKIQTQLDPDNTNPDVSWSFFQRAMNHWINSVKGEDISTSLSEFSTNFGQNLASELSLNESKTHNNNTSIDVNLEEQVSTLKYQLNKAIADLELVKQQFAACEEQNEGLIAELNSLHRLQNRDQHSNEQINDKSNDSLEKDEELSAASKKQEQLQKKLENQEKQQKSHLAQINKLENENQELKRKLHTYETRKQDDRRTINDLRQILDEKELELSMLTEDIDNLKTQLEEKNELVEFYTKEHDLLKQRTLQLEEVVCKSSPRGRSMSLENSPKNVFNSPKLLHQLANPVTPRLSNSPVLKLKSCVTSTPLSKKKGSSSMNTSLESCGSYDVFSDINVVTMLRSPHKTLKEELAEVVHKRAEECEELKQLHAVVKDQEDIKNNLWQNLKQLSCDNEMLLDYKKDITDMMNSIHEKDEVIEYLQIELKTVREQMRQKLEDDNESEKRILQVIAAELTNVENSLREQLSINTKAETNIATLNRKLQSKEKALLDDTHETIERLTKQLKSVKINLRKEQLSNLDLRKRLLSHKSMLNKGTETDKDECAWEIRPMVETVCDPKKTNFAKQQIRMERMLEKQSKLEKDLASEKKINTKLTMRYEELRVENEKNTKDLKTCRDEMLKQMRVLHDVDAEKKILKENIVILNKEGANLRIEISQLKMEKAKLLDENNNLNKNLCDSSIKLVAINKLLLDKHREVEIKIKEKLDQEREFNKKMIHLKSANDLVIKQLEGELTEKRSEMEDLEAFFSISNRDLRSVIAEVCDHLLKYDYCIDQTLLEKEESLMKNDTIIGLEKEKIMLRNNIKMITLIFTTLMDKQLSLLQQIEAFEQKEERDEADEIIDGLQDVSVNSELLEESFFSCESSLSEQEMLQVIGPLQSDLLLKNLELEKGDTKDLSKEELEEKFTNLALVFNVDITMSKKKYLNQQEKFNSQLLNFFTYLNCTIDMMKKLSSSQNKRSVTAAMNYLQLLKDISDDTFKSALECGILYHEKRIASCWKLVVDYVAVLARENSCAKQTSDSKESIQLVSSHFSEIDKQDANRNLHTAPYLRLSLFNRVKHYVCLFFIVLIVFVIIQLIYVDRICQKGAKRICPIQWITNFVIKKTHSSSSP